MYEVGKNGKVFTNKSVGTGPSSCGKNLPGCGLTNLRNTVVFAVPKFGPCSAKNCASQRTDVDSASTIAAVTSLL